jgi:uncharacterized membrane protein YczE
MAFGVILLAKSDLGISPISAIPYILSLITPFTFGTMTLAFHLLCVLFQVVIWRKITLKIILQIPLTLGFSALLDLFMSFIKVTEHAIWLRTILCFFGIIFTALGIVMIVSMDLMLPPPDAFLRAVSSRFKIELYKVKIVGDVSWVVITFVISLLSTRKVLAIGVGTLLSMYLTGKFVGIFKKYLQFMEMEPTEVAWERYLAQRKERKETVKAK